MSDTPTNAQLSDSHLHTLAAVLDGIIPPSPDGRLPGAGQLGLASVVDAALDQMAGLRPIIAQGLDVLDERARGRDADGFAALSDGGRLEVLNGMAEDDPVFLPGLVFHCYTAYYRNPRVIALLGLEARPPYPEGYEMEPDDFGLLQAVRTRAPMYRGAE